MIALAVLLAPAVVWAKSERRPADVVHPITTQLIHQQNLAARKAQGLDKPRAVSLEAAPEPVDELVVDDIGNIAVVDDGDGVFLPPVEFDLNGKTLGFIPADAEATAYSYEVRDGGYDGEAAVNGNLVLMGDDDSRLLPLPFAFPFFGESYSEVFLNSDGNLTFGEADNASTARDPARAVSGPPRILGFFFDLDPTVPGSIIRVLSESDRIVISWINVPIFTTDQSGLPQNFQIILFADGRIDFAYRDITINAGIIGIASGTNIAESMAVDFSEPTTDTFSAAVVEIFVPAFVDLAVLGQKFYLSHEDAYDFLVVFHNYEIPIDTGAFAFYQPIRNFVQGIGPFPDFLAAQNVVDFGELLGSPQRLQGLLYMGILEQYPEEPNARIDRDFGLGVSTPLTVLAHEAGHRFLARTLFIDPATNEFSLDMLGRQLSHWSYFFNSEASFLEGNRIVDHGAGAFRFETVDAVQGFSRLDLYLMGLLPPEEVPPLFAVRNPSIGDAVFTPGHEPLAGVFFDGERVDITLDDIVAAHGPRRPDHRLSQRNFRFAFLLLKKEGAEVPAGDIEKMERFRAAFGDYFEEKVENRAAVESELVQKLGLTVWPAAGVLEGETLRATVFLESPTLEPVEVQLSADGGVIQAPASVTIPAGALFTDFPIRGVDAGVGQLTAAAGEGFEVSHANIQVLGDTANLSITRLLPLEILLGDPRERLKTGRVSAPMPFAYFFQVFDNNLLTYGGVPFKITVSGDGRVDPPNPVSDEFGFITVEWTLASTPGENTMRVEVEGSAQPPLEIRAVGVRSPPRHRNFRELLFGP